MRLTQRNSVISFGPACLGLLMKTENHGRENSLTGSTMTLTAALIELDKDFKLFKPRASRLVAYLPCAGLA
jgi:hypothetical protein